MKVKFEFKPQDFWIGMYTETRGIGPHEGFEQRWRHVWICFIPMFPIHLWWYILPYQRDRDDL